MSSKSNDQGRAYEFAWGNALLDALQGIRQAVLVKNSSYEANKRAWESMPAETKELYELSADSAVDSVLELEPLMTEIANDILSLEFQKDDSGRTGDVRDLIVKRDGISWEVGLSIKHNHDAVKHSRLSHRLDFGKEWFGLPCSKQYWDSIAPIFDRLKKEKANGTKWSEIDQKDKTVYVPLLDAFIKEVLKADSNSHDIPKRMVEYLIGNKDYYKVVSKDGKRLTIIHTFNIHGTLNKPSKVKVSAITVPTVLLPTELVALRFKTGSTNTVEMYLNNGWQLSFRLHSASTKVEPSLKFDVQFIGMPVSILNIECKWKS